LTTENDALSWFLFCYYVYFRRAWYTTRTTSIELEINQIMDLVIYIWQETCMQLTSKLVASRQLRFLKFLLLIVELCFCVANDYKQCTYNGLTRIKLKLCASHCLFSMHPPTVFFSMHPPTVPKLEVCCSSTSCTGNYQFLWAVVRLLDK